MLTHAGKDLASKADDEPRDADVCAVGIDDLVTGVSFRRRRTRRMATTITKATMVMPATTAKTTR